MYIKIQVYSCRLDLHKHDDSISVYVIFMDTYDVQSCICAYKEVYKMRMSLHKLYIHTMMYMYTYFRCKNPLINLGMKRCNEHCSVGPAPLPIGQVHGGSLFVTDAGRVWTWGVEMWKVWKSIDLSDSRLKRLDASQLMLRNIHIRIYIWYSIHINVMVREEDMSKSWGNWPFYIAYGLPSSRKKAEKNWVINACCVLFII